MHKSIPTIFYFQPQLVGISDNWICKVILSDEIQKNGNHWQYVTAPCWSQYACHIVSCNKIFHSGRRMDLTAIVDYARIEQKCPYDNRFLSQWAFLGLPKDDTFLTGKLLFFRQFWPDVSFLKVIFFHTFKTKLWLRNGWKYYKSFL